MYKYLLCWRYLRTRYIALASIISVMLGVATMIVVNSVMAGFSTMMEERLHGTLSDIIVESFSLNGFNNPDEVLAAIEEAAGDQIDALAPSLQLFGYAMIPVGGGEYLTREVQIIGVRPEDRARVSEFAEYLVHQPREGQADLPPAEPTFHVPEEFRLNTYAGQVYQRTDPDDPFADILLEDMANLVPADGMILGYALGTIHRPESDEDLFIAPEGSKVILHFPSAGKTPEAKTGEFTVVSYFKSGMSEYDSMQVFVPIERLQFLRGQDGFVNQIQVKARPGADLEAIASAIRLTLERKWPTRFLVSTWEQKQGPLLAAVQVEQNILNILLSFIIAVAGFGILGIFSMIVVEKTKDIGILKALGASDSGVRGIFLGYGLTLGLVGSLVGMTGGLLFVRYINEIEDALSVMTGRKVFDDAIYYFPEIPTLVEPLTVAWIVGGALLIAVAASVWPAQRAARMHPVKSLRYE
ncbi:ABC transporter permease [Tautonia sociabilis]|uniref:FtsX-like permease family protein n=1 Tax=Tautonia sociabilis TaxID=2080755 RepID=A0A432MKR1_9BACT|nr:FtsX-like permease family protein [Tautonia sociabilis]RUL87668.1 FtsX-like permease family protein [Tautonia sociabilis]